MNVYLPQVSQLGSSVQPAPSAQPGTAVLDTSFSPWHPFQGVVPGSAMSDILVSQPDVTLGLGSDAGVYLDSLNVGETEGTDIGKAALGSSNLVDTEDAFRQVSTADISNHNSLDSPHVAKSAGASTSQPTLGPHNPANAPPPLVEPSLPFVDEDHSDPHSVGSPAKPLIKASLLKDVAFVLPMNKEGRYEVFVDKILPPLSVAHEPHEAFSTDYFVALHKLVSAPGPSHKKGTPNYLGARIPLQHTTLKMDRWRYHLRGYEHVDICQFLEFGFPLGLQSDPEPVLQSSLRNHGSAYQFYTWIDEFLQTGIKLGDMAGPFLSSPFDKPHISPLMTAIKKPNGRRAVFDASFGDLSLNNNTPSDFYLGQPISYAFPKIEDFKRLVLNCGRGCMIWKRDLSRYFLQIPLDPLEYSLVAFIWRSKLFFFCGLMFGLRHSGFQGQKITDGVTWIHRRLGLETVSEKMYNSINYSDDIGGCEESLDRANAAYDALAVLLTDLGLRESKSKAHPPSTCMPYLGVEFDTVAMVMRVPPEKVSELQDDLGSWSRKTTSTKKNLQQLLGKLFWVARCVRFSRGFMSRLLAQLKAMHKLGDNKKAPLSDECRQDIKWWDRYLRRFNGCELLYPTDPLDLSLDQLLDSSAMVNCGDAQPMGGGSYFGNEYWSRQFPKWLQDPKLPIHLKEFWVVVVSAWLWGNQWRGHLVYIFCDNTAVVEVLQKERPKDPGMQELLREFLFIVCSRGFTPVFRKIGTKSNETADFISRRHDRIATQEFFAAKNLPQRNLIEAPDHLFSLRSNW